METEYISRINRAPDFIENKIEKQNIKIATLVKSKAIKINVTNPPYKVNANLAGQ